MTAQNDPETDDKATPEPTSTGPAAPDQVGEGVAATPSATSTEDIKPDMIGETEQAAAPETEPPHKKKSKPKKAKRAQARADTGAQSKRATGAKEDTAKTTASSSTDGSPNLRCLKVIREAAPVLPSGILPPAIDEVFPDPASRGVLASALLSAAAAAAGHAVGVAGGKEEGQGVLGLRVAIISDVTSLGSIIAPVLQAAYAVQADETKTWMAEEQREFSQAAVAAVRQRIYRQTMANAAILGIDGLSDAEATPAAISAPPAVRPYFVLRDPVPTAVKQGLANASKGMLIIDGTKLPTLAGWGRNYLVDLADLLNDGNAGELLELADPMAHGAVRMRSASISVIGMLSQLDTFSLYKAEPKALASTMFVPVEAPSKTVAANAAKLLTAMLARLRALEPEDEGRLRRLRLSADARRSLEQLKRRLMRASNDELPPLADVYAGAADLVLRIAASLHLLDHAVGNADKLAPEIENEVMQRAVDFVEQYAFPAARSVLGPASIDPVQRNARRVLSFAQQSMAIEDDLTVRDLFRHLRRSITKKIEMQRAVDLLISDGLLLPKTPSGQIYTMHSAVFAPENLLPDLAGDPRRPRN